MNIRKKIIRAIIGGVIMVTTTSMLTGCIGPVQRKAKTEKLLEEKYQEKFEVISCGEVGLFSDYYSAVAYSEKYPDMPFQVSVTKDEEVADSYVTKRVCARISEKINRNMATLENDCFIYTEPRIMGTVLTDPEVSLEDYLKDSPGTEFLVYLFLSSEGADASNIVEALRNAMNGLPEVRGAILLYLPDNELMIQIQEYIAKSDKIYSSFDKFAEQSYIGFFPCENISTVATVDKLCEMAGDLL